MRPNNSLRWLILAPAIFFALTTPANAEPQPGLNTTYYTIDEIPPLRSTSEYPICGTETENNINRSYDGEPYENCTGDLFMVHMTGYIDIPEHTTIEFMLATDDGGYADIGGNEFESWNDQGCTWIPSGQLEIEVGVQPLDVWMYENGGSSCIMLAWNIDDAGWAIVPDEAFTQTSTPTTTIPETTTTSEPTTTVPETTIPETTIPETTTTTTVYVPPATTTTEPTEEEAPPPDTTLPPPEDDEPDETTPETLPEDEPDTTQPETDDPETESTPEEPDPIEETEEESSESTIPDDEEEQDIEEPAVEEPQESITAILANEPTPEQALTLATDPEVLANISEEQAEQIFETLDVAALTEEQTTELIAAVQDAPIEVREAFEDKVDIFKNALDTYIPTGSNIPVGERRALIAIGAALTAAAATRIRR